jgi:hypothetical protein
MYTFFTLSKNFSFLPSSTTRSVERGFSSFLQNKFKMGSSNASSENIFDSRGDDVKLFIKDLTDKESNLFVKLSEQMHQKDAQQVLHNNPNLTYIKETFKFTKETVDKSVESTHTFLMNDDPTGTFINFVLNHHSSLSRRVATILVRRLLVFTIAEFKHIPIFKQNVALIKSDVEQLGLIKNKDSIVLKENGKGLFVETFTIQNVKMSCPLNPAIKELKEGKQHLSSIEYLVSDQLIGESGIKIESKVGHATAFSMKTALEKFNEK